MSDEVVPPEWRPGATRPIYALTLRTRFAQVGNRRVEIVEVTKDELLELRMLRVAVVILFVALFGGAWMISSIIGKCAV